MLTITYYCFLIIQYVGTINYIAFENDKINQEIDGVIEAQSNKDFLEALNLPNIYFNIPYEYEYYISEKVENYKTN